MIHKMRRTEGEVMDIVGSIECGIGGSCGGDWRRGDEVVGHEGLGGDEE
jgi:hypothetical protein